MAPSDALFSMPIDVCALQASACGVSESGLGEGEDEEDLCGLRGRIQQVLGSAREVTQQDTASATANAANGKTGGAAKQAVGSGATQQR